jgi:hypothetical protein
MRRSATVIIAAAVTVGLAGTAPAAVQRVEYGPPQGVRATATGKTVEIRFTGASATFGKAHAGRPVVVTCAAHPVPGLAFTGPDADDAVDDALDGLATVRVAADGASVRATFKRAPGDACEIHGLENPALPSSEIARAALTPAGATWIDEETLGTRMVDLAYAASPSGTYRTAADVVALGGGNVVALDTPDATPPAGKLGYWSHGRAVSFVATSAAGRHLVLQDLGGGMLRTDVLEALAGWTPPQGIKLPGAAGDDGDTRSDPVAENGPGEDLGPDDGVTGHLAGRTLVVRFSGGKAAKAYRSIAGHRIEVLCVTAPATPLLGGRTSFGPGNGAAVRVPRRGGIVRVALPSGSRDICVLTFGDREVATVVPSAAGRRYLGGLAALAAFFEKVPDDLGVGGATSYPGAQTIAAAHPGLIPMATPGQALTPGRLGVWTDAHQQALLAMATASGQRFVIADEGGGRIRTNVFTPLLALGASLL